MIRFIALGALSCFSALVLSPGPAQAESVVEEARLGLLAQGWGGPGADKEQGVGFNGEVVFASPDFLSAIGAPRPQIGFTIASDSDATNQAYIGLEWQVYLKKRFFASASVGGSVHDGEVDYTPFVDRPRLGDTVFLGCRVLFRLAGDIGYDITDRISASIHLAHISNANLCDVNEGLDHLGVRIGYRF